MQYDYATNPAGQIVRRVSSNDNYAWTAFPRAGRSYGVDGLNRYTSVGGQGYGYDGRGNLTAAGSSGYSYTARNLLLTAPNDLFYYDALGRLDMEDTGRTIFTYAGSNVLFERDYSDGHPDLPVKKRYVYGAGGAPLLWYEGAGTSDKRWLASDERGSVTSVLDGSGVATANRYDEFGVPDTNNVGRFQYTGQMWLPNIALYHYKARTYSATLGRFLQADPIGYGDGINWYNYVGGDPVNYIDPLGLGRCLKPGPGEIVVCANTPLSGAGPGGVNTLPQTEDIDRPDPDKVKKEPQNDTSCPVNSPATVLSPFGSRSAPTAGASTNHNGVDFRNRLGSPVFATQNGSILRVFNAGHGGSSIIVLNDDGSVSGYAHSKATVGVGADVDSGDPIGYSDGSGNITGPHLHYTYAPTQGAAKVDPMKQLGHVCGRR